MPASRPSTAQSLTAALTSWRLGSLSLLSVSSGMPLGLVLTTVPAWMAMSGVDIKTIGLVTLTQVPYAFKFLWAPLLDRFRPPALGRKRGWVLLAQLVLAAATFALARSATGSPEVGLVAALSFLIACASATQDIAIDAYAVETLRPEEHGLAVGARTAMYRAGMWVAGYLAISMAPTIGWSATLMIQAAIYLALLPVTVFAPEPESAEAPPTSLRAAIWDPFVGFFQQHRALEIAAFLFFYKLADNLAGALSGPFLVQVGFGATDVGLGRGVITFVAMLGGTFLGGLLTTRMGVARSLWVFGFLQAISNLGYAAVAEVGLNRPLMFCAIAVESATTGMGNGAFGVLLLRLTSKRFSATQYALFSSIFALGRTITGPPAGAFVDAIGWRDFFLLTVPAAIPGLLMLYRFAPWASAELAEPSAVSAGTRGAALSGRALVGVGAVCSVLGAGLGLLASASLSALKATRTGATFDLIAALNASFHPARAIDAVDLIGSGALGLVVGVGVAAYLAATRGVRS